MKASKPYYIRLISWVVLLLLLCSGDCAAQNYMNAPGGNELYGSSSGKYMQLGSTLMDRKDYSHAIAYFDAAIKAKEHPPLALMNEAVCYYNLKYRSRAMQCLIIILQNYPKSRMVESAKHMLKTITGSNPPAQILVQDRDSSAQSSNRTSGTDNSDKALHYAVSPSGHMIVPCFLNRQPIAGIFDTGASVTWFSNSQLKNAKIELKTKRSNIRTVGIGGESEVQEASVDFWLGNIHKENFLVIVENDEILRRNQGESAVLDYGLVGANAFGDCAFTINDRNHTITFHKNGFTPATNSSALSFRMEGNEIIVRPKVNGRECDMTLDTGCSSVAFTDRLLPAIGMSVPTDSRLGQSLGIGGKRSSRIFEINSIKMGNVEKKNVKAACDMQSGIEYPLLGRSFLEGLILTIDPRQKKLYISE